MSNQATEELRAALSAFKAHQLFGGLLQHHCLH